MDAAVIPLPIEETTPPVTKTYFGTGALFYAGAAPSARRFANLPHLTRTPVVHMTL
jgi:hypothetical protein